MSLASLFRKTDAQHAAARHWSTGRRAALNPRSPSVVRRRAGLFALGGAIALQCAFACSPATAGSSAQTPSPDEQKTEGEKTDLKAQFSRESEPISKQPVSAKGAWTAYIEAKSAPKIVAHEEVVEVIADLGWDSELHCLVYPEAIDAGAAIHTSLKNASESVEFQAVTPYALDRDGLVPIVGVRGIYRVNQDGVVLAGDYKIMVMPRSDYAVLCFHDAAGYAQSFMRVTSEFARSFKYESKESPSIRGELWSVTLDETPVGFSQHSTYELEGKKLRRVSVSSSFIPTAPGQLAVEDRVSVVTTDLTGNLIDGKYVTFENGETSLSVDVERAKQTYNYVGTVQSKEVRGSFKTKKPVLSAYAFEKRIKGISKKPQKSSFEQLEYTPSLDPGQASAVTYDVTPQEGALLVVASIGQRSVSMHANTNGVVDELHMPVGSRTVESKLLEEVGGL